MEDANDLEASGGADTERARVTIVVVPRERFNLSLPSLDSIYEHTSMPFELVYVDGRSPKPVRRALEVAAVERGFTLIRRNRYLAPNEARAIGLAEVRTPYVVFVDNDLFVEDGWLERLVECADETGAWAVGPLYFEGDPADEVVHMAGGDLEFQGDAPLRRLRSTHRFQSVPLAEVHETLQREPCAYLEFHCMLVRVSAFEHITLDQQLLSVREHVDIGIQIAEAGGQLWVEPASRVTYAEPESLALSDIPYYLLRWSEAWNEASSVHFMSKHGIDPAHARMGAGRRRYVVFKPVSRRVEGMLGPRGQQALRSAFSTVEKQVNRLVYPSHSKG
jgi:GT2 family glycosyltransferase